MDVNNLLDDLLFAEDSVLVVRPHADDEDGFGAFVYAVPDPVLDVDAAAVVAFQIAYEFFVWRWILEGILFENLDKPLCFFR